jgi:hypothetical protein
MKGAMLLFLFASMSYATFAVEVNPYANTILRYENEVEHDFFNDRERLRLIARAGIDIKYNDTWSSRIGLRTGLRDRQNVPAITVARFTDQRQPPNDIFIDRLYVTGKFDKLTLNLGKIPWGTKQVSDIFWDRDLNPIGVHADYAFSNKSKIAFAHFAPLDGEDGTIGQMSIVQWQHQRQIKGWQWTVAPWLVNYHGQVGADFAFRDTQFDNRFVRLSTFVKKGPWQFGLDLGRSFENFAQLSEEGFDDQKNSIVVEIKHGNLKQVGHYLWHIRFLRVERFAVISEFAQNATSPVDTSNTQGIDLRLRRKMGARWWLGTRFSRLQRLVGLQEEGIRFRIEARYDF